MDILFMLIETSLSVEFGIAIETSEDLNFGDRICDTFTRFSRNGNGEVYKEGLGGISGIDPNDELTPLLDEDKRREGDITSPLDKFDSLISIIGFRVCTGI
jgi:hypothetical protein